MVENVNNARNAEEIESELGKLVPKIKKEHDHAVATYRKGLEHARKAGELLQEAWKRVEKHPTLAWAKWVKDNLTFSKRHADNYRAIYRGWGKIETAGDKIDTVRGALAVVHERPAKPSRKAKTKMVLKRSRLADVAAGRNVTVGLLELLLADLGLTSLIQIEDDAAPAAA